MRSQRARIWGAGLVAAAILATAAFIVVRTTGSEPGKPLYDGPGILTAAEAGAFTRFPLVSFGESYRGHRLVLIQEEVLPAVVNTSGAELAPPLIVVTFGYDAKCTERPCELPVQVKVSPACIVPRGTFPAEVLLGPEQELAGGARAQAFPDGHIRIWTGSISVAIFDQAGAGRLDASGVLEALRPVNGAATALAADWPAPDAPAPCPPGLLPDPIKYTPPTPPPQAN